MRQKKQFKRISLFFFFLMFTLILKAQSEYQERKLCFSIANNYFQYVEITNNLNEVINPLISYNFQFGLYYNLISQTNTLKIGVKWQPLYTRFQTNIGSENLPINTNLIESGKTEDWFGDAITVPVLFEKKFENNKKIEFTLTSGINFHLAFTNELNASPGQYFDTTDLRLNNEIVFTPFLTTNYQQKQVEFSTAFVFGIGILAKTLKGNYRLNLMGNLNFWNMRNVDYQFDNLATINHAGTFNLKGNYIGAELVITPKKKKKE